MIDNEKIFNLFIYILTAYLRRYGSRVAGIMCLIIMGSIATVAAPYLFSKAIDKIISSEVTGNYLIYFFTYALALGAMTFLQKINLYLAVVQTERMSHTVADLFYDNINRKPPAFFQDYNATQILSAQHQGNDAISKMVQMMLAAFIPSAISIVLAFIILVKEVNITVVLISLCYGVFFVVLTIIANIKCRYHLDNASRSTQESVTTLGDMIAMIEPLRYTNSQPWMKTRYANKVSEVLGNWQHYAMKRIAFSSVTFAGIALQFSITFAILIPQYHEGDLSVGDIVLFNALLLQLSVPFELIAQSVDEYTRSIAKLKPMARIWFQDNDNVDQPETYYDLTGMNLSVSGLTHIFENGHGLNPTSFQCEPGRITFVIGETGSGKSTLLKLLLKSYKPSAGSIHIGGLDLNDISQTNWYNSIGVVPQDVILFNDTLKNNITLGRPLDEKRLRDAARKASILKRIEGCSDGFDTLIGERGMKLSGGERQRIAIARAIYTNPSILLLDEASSALDEQTESEIMRNLRALNPDLSIIAVTHRLSIINDGDQVIDLDTAISGRSPPVKVVH